MTAHELLTNLHRQGFVLTPLPGEKLEVRPASKLTPELRAELKQRKGEVLALLNQQPAPWPCPPHEQRVNTPAAVEFIPGTRDFLSRPLGRENDPDPWDAWGGLFDWLREHRPERFFAICGVEEEIRALEQQGITAGSAYETACQELARRFTEKRV